MTARRGKWSRRRTAALSAGCALLCGAVVAGCGTGDTGEAGANTVRWYVFNEPGGAFEEAITRCNEEARGAYKIYAGSAESDAQWLSPPKAFI